MQSTQHTDFARIQINQTEYIEAFLAENYKSFFPNHWHAHFCISIIEKGIFNENEYFAEEGSVFITNPMEVHKNDLIFDQGTSFKTIYISQDLMDKYGGIFGMRLACRAIKDKFLFKLIDKIAVQILAKDNSFDIKDVTFLITHLKNNYQEDLDSDPIIMVENAKQGQGNFEKIRQIKQYVNQNYLEKLTIDNLADILGMEKTYFIKFYKKNTGISPFEYIMVKRIQHGMDLIQKGNNITESALSSGFYDQSQFIRYFKKICRSYS